MMLVVGGRNVATHDPCAGGKGERPVWTAIQEAVVQPQLQGPSHMLSLPSP